MSSIKRLNPKSTALTIFLIELYALFVASYFVLRYQGRWLDVDTSRMVQIVRSMQQYGYIENPGKMYAFGYSYPFASILLSALTRLEPFVLLTVVRPLLIVVLPPLVYIFYRQVLQREHIAAIGVFFLLLQPELMFVLMRGSHELLTWSCVLLACFALTRSYLYASRLRLFISCLLLFYCAAYALTSTSVFFATSFLFGLTVSFIIGKVNEGLFPTQDGSRMKKVINRLLFTILASAVLLFIFVFFIYPSAQRPLFQLRTISDKLQALFLNFEIETDPYQTFIPSIWIDPRLYPALTLANWLTLALSFIAWLKIGYRRLIKRDAIFQPLYFVWLMYTAFALQLYLSVIVDYSGALSGNLQLRVFPPLILMGVPLATGWLFEIAQKYRQGIKRLRPVVLSVISLLIIWLIAAAVLKSTAEPVLSNKWSFATVGEEAGLLWMNRSITYGPVWISPDDRLREISFGLIENPRTWIKYDIYSLDQNTRYIFWSNLNEMLTKRYRISMPDFKNLNLIYTNGTVSIYKTKPKTSFER